MSAFQQLERPFKRVIIYSMCVLSLVGCHSMNSSYTDLFEKSNQSIHGVQFTQPQADALAGRFVATFNQLGTPQFMTSARDLFADDLYVNDTLSVYYRFSDLAAHFDGMNQSVSDSQVVLQHVLLAGDSVFVHWKMTYTLKLFGSKKTMSSFGISQLKVNAEGKIIFQQDYWDSNNGLYRQLPVAGSLYRLLLPLKQ